MRMGALQCRVVTSGSLKVLVQNGKDREGKGACQRTVQAFKLRHQDQTVLLLDPRSGTLEKKNFFISFIFSHLQKSGIIVLMSYVLIEYIYIDI